MMLKSFITMNTGLLLYVFERDKEREGGIEIETEEREREIKPEGERTRYSK